MAMGGRRVGAGRKKGATEMRTREVSNKLAADGQIMPLEVMVRTMRALWGDAENTTDPVEQRKLQVAACAIAEKAAPFHHPRLAAIEHSGGVTIRHEDALAALEEPLGEAATVH